MVEVQINIQCADLNEIVGQRNGTIDMNFSVELDDLLDGIGDNERVLEALVDKMGVEDVKKQLDLE